MSFSAHLEQVLKQVEGAVACSVMGFDGYAVETQTSKDPGVDFEAMLVEYGTVLTNIRETAEGLKAGSVSEVVINTDKLITIARLLTPQYYLVLALTPEGNYGKGRYALRIVAPKVTAELA
ncbi:MAG TPA: hypothetical protein VGK67_22845 [Myxococcales bacterium]|jgi:predicted regulator of Ras-like GTPase activity (Roadblock/LC7/MglB family)